MWSDDGKYLSTYSKSCKNFSVFQVDKGSQENMWSVIDALRRDARFWSRFPINFVTTPME